MIIEKVDLSQFRNIERERLLLHPVMNVFLGENGQGKTNILEALYLLCTGQSFRQGSNLILIREGAATGLVRAQVSNRGLTSELKMTLEPRRKYLAKDNKKYSASALAKTQGAVLFSPESLSSIKDGAEGRRRLVDDMLGTFDNSAIQTLHTFQRQLRARNRVLKSIAQAEPHESTREQEDVLHALNIQYFDLVYKVTELRLRALRELRPEIEFAIGEISGFSVDIAVEYVVSDNEVMDKSVDEVRNLIDRRAAQLQAAEKASGTSLIGPQKHDIRLLYNGKDSRYYCSQGQQRALILAFKMAQIVYHRKVHGVYPVLMLDDVLSELDEAKREKLVNFLAKVDTQIFITTTDFGLPASLGTDELTVFQVKQGRVTSDR